MFMGSMWALCGYVKKEDEKRTWGILCHSMLFCFRVWVMRGLSWRCGICVTLERGEEYGIVLYLYYFNGKWLK
jgi:hypothetical protein